MESCDVLVVGGGPAGSSCAWKLRQAGLDVRVLDKSRFPRTKLCGGWITPEAVKDLEIDISAYPHRFLTFDHIHLHAYGLQYRSKTVQHSIRRYEFDDWLLKRSGVQVTTHEVRSIKKENGYYLVDDTYRAKYLVGAGGTRCPVYRTFFRQQNPQARTLQTVVLEQEFAYDWQDGCCHLWFFGNGLPGYSWYVPKADGYLNVGVGGMAKKLKARKDDIKNHWHHFTDMLEKKNFVNGFSFKPSGYTYYLRSGVDIERIENAFVIGDSAGLASRDMGEGIGPAVRSGILAADSIARGTPYSLASVRSYSMDNVLAKRLLKYMFE